MCRQLNCVWQITNEFKFPIAAFHHAHETYLVPDTLKSAYGKSEIRTMRLPHIMVLNTSIRKATRLLRHSSPRTVGTSARRSVAPSSRPVSLPRMAYRSS